MSYIFDNGSIGKIEMKHTLCTWCKHPIGAIRVTLTTDKGREEVCATCGRAAVERRERMENRQFEIPPSCTCDRCVSYCECRPGWPLPSEAVRLIEAGFGDRLMKDWWVGDGLGGGDILLLSPAIKGYEGRHAPLEPKGRCTFLTENNKCELHDLRLKPFECRMAHHSLEGSTRTPPHEVVAMEWNTEDNQQIVDRLKERHENLRYERS